MAYPYQNPYQPYNPYQQPAYQPPNAVQPQNSYSCRPVTSREEALAMQTDFLSAGTVMPDLSHGVIYLKRFNPNTGAADFYEFVTRQQSEQQAQYVSAEEFNAFKDDVLSRMEAVGV